MSAMRSRLSVRVPLLVAACQMCAIGLLFVFSNSFHLEILSRAISNAVASMSQTMLAVVIGVVQWLARLAWRRYTEGAEAVKQHWKQEAGFGLASAAFVWLCLVCYQVAWKIPSQIREEASKQRVPPVAQIKPPPDWDYRPSKGSMRSVTIIQRPVIIQEVQSLGNLKQQAADLAAEVMKDLCHHGWISHLWNCREVDPFGPIQAMPDTSNPDVFKDWLKHRSDYFRIVELSKVREVRDSLAKANFRNKDLDMMLQTEDDQEKVEQISGLKPIELSPYSIELIATSLLKLAQQI